MSSSKELVVAHHPLSVVAESYRAIRTSLLFHQVENPPRVMLLTSPAPGDGKTVTVLNLAIALAQDGHNVLVIDGDMRKGCCHVRMGLRNHVGLSNVLTGQVSYEQAVQATAIPRLFVLTRGNCPPNPSELVGTRRMRQLLAGLREKYDYILIDSPPVIAVSDTAILSTICEGVLLVLHSKNSTLALARQALERLASVKAKVLGTILNNINLANPDYAYYRHYHEYHPDFSGEENSDGNQKHDTSQIQPKWAFPQAQPANGAETVSQEFVERIISELTEAVGPMASLIVRDQIEILGEPQYAFPKSRLGELVDRICEEILDENLKKRFQSSMSESFRALETSTSS
jgi:capsular exopolysaccharide synthesis family protein